VPRRVALWSRSSFVLRGGASILCKSTPGAFFGTRAPSLVVCAFGCDLCTTLIHTSVVDPSWGQAEMGIGHRRKAQHSQRALDGRRSLQTVINRRACALIHIVIRLFSINFSIKSAQIPFHARDQNQSLLHPNQLNALGAASATHLHHMLLVTRAAIQQGGGGLPRAATALLAARGISNANSSNCGATPAAAGGNNAASPTSPLPGHLRLAGLAAKPPQLPSHALPLRSPRRAFGHAVHAPAPGHVVSFPLAQTGEGISECELVEWHVQVRAARPSHPHTAHASSSASRPGPGATF
jgi:hypothetical protein